MLGLPLYIILICIQCVFLEGLILIISIVLLVLSFVYCLWRELGLKKKEKENQVFSMLMEAQDITVFEETDVSIKSKITLKDYFKRAFQKFGATIAMIKESLENNKSYEKLIYTYDKSQYVIKTFPLFVSSKKYAVIQITDVTKHISNLLEFKKSFEDIKEFLDLSPFGVLYLDDANRITGINSTAANYLESSKEELLGKSIFDFLHTKDESSLNKESIKDFTLNDTTTFKAIWLPSNAHAYVFYKLYLIQNFFDLSAFDFSVIPSVIINVDGEILKANNAFCKFIEYSNNNSIFDSIENNEELKKVLKDGKNTTMIECQFDSKYSTGYLTKIDSVWLAQFVDISDQKILEQQFIQSQKMQAVGQLAGGIAHDFNNLLTAMIGFCDLLLQRYLPNDPSYADVLQIKQSGNRAANLVRQLLAFSKRQTLQSKVVQISDILLDVSNLLRRLIGASIELKLSNARDLWKVKVDPGQFEQVVINLAVNARDAMQENGGILTIKTENVSVNYPEKLLSETLSPGDYVMIEVSDSGHGIKKEHLNRIFEPFFSTKQMSAGTGLGLSTVYGIIHQTGGAIDVTTILKKGTTFKIFLPRYTGSTQEEDPTLDLEHIDLSGRETILLVEDEDAVRRFGSRALKEKGYNVIETSSGEDALKAIEDGLEFDLLITDVVMPRIDGPTLCKKLRENNKNVKVIFISGYAEDTFRQNVDLDPFIHFLGKPFTLNDLITKVKDVLKSK